MAVVACAAASANLSDAAIAVLVLSRAISKRWQANEAHVRTRRVGVLHAPAARSFFELWAVLSFLSFQDF